METCRLGGVSTVHPRNDARTDGQPSDRNISTITLEKNDLQ